MDKETKHQWKDMKNESELGNLGKTNLANIGGVHMSQQYFCFVLYNKYNNLCCIYSFMLFMIWK